MSDSSIIQAISAIVSAFITALASIAVAYIQNAKKPETSQLRVLLPEGVKISQRKKISISFILLFILLGGIFGYFVSGLFTVLPDVPQAPKVVETLSPTIPPVATLTIVPAQTNTPFATLTVVPTPTYNSETLMPDWIQNPTNGHYYKELPFMGTWHDCEEAAVAEGAHLVTINDEEEQIWLVQTFYPDQYWIGFTDEGDEGHWRWVSGEPVTYTNWQPGEPSNFAGIEHYGESDIRRPNNGKWNDDKDAVLQWAIIERVIP